MILSDALIFVGSDGPVEDQNLARAIEQRAEALPLYDPNAAFKGYKWYDRLPRVDLTGYRAHVGAQTHEMAVEDSFNLQTRPDRLEVLLTRTDAAGTEEWALPAALFSPSDDSEARSYDQQQQ